MNWLRLYSEFATDAKVQMMSEAMQRRLVMLFCIQSSNGIETFQKQECETSIAFLLRISAAELADTKREFFRFGFINDDWTLRNWSKRQYVSDSSTARVHKHRAAKKRSETKERKNVKRFSNVLDTDAEQIQNREDQELERVVAKAPTEPAATKNTRGSRLPDDWQLTPELRAEARRLAPQIDADAEAAKFRDHWRAAAGAKGRKADWPATWRNWLRMAPGFAPRNTVNGNQPSRSMMAIRKLQAMKTHDDEPERVDEERNPQRLIEAPDVKPRAPA